MKTNNSAPGYWVVKEGGVYDNEYPNATFSIEGDALIIRKDSGAVIAIYAPGKWDAIRLEASVDG